MKITKVVKEEKNLYVPTRITRVMPDYSCSKILGINCRIGCDECVLSEKNIIDFLEYVREQDETK